MLFADEAGDEGGPAGLVGGTEAFAGFGVEVFVEEEMLVPKWTTAMGVMSADEVAGTIGAGGEQFDEAFAEIERDFFEGQFFP